jgi:hypothetical protein
MKKKQLGSSFFDDVKRRENKNPSFRKDVEEHKEKAMLGKMLREIREPQEILKECRSPDSNRDSVATGGF